MKVNKAITVIPVLAGVRLTLPMSIYCPVPDEGKENEEMLKSALGPEKVGGVADVLAGVAPDPFT